MSPETFNCSNWIKNLVEIELVGFYVLKKNRYATYIIRALIRLDNRVKYVAKQNLVVDDLGERRFIIPIKYECKNNKKK